VQQITNNGPARVQRDGKRLANCKRRQEHESAASGGQIEPPLALRIQGQLLRQSDRREVAIFLRDGALCVADFIDGEGILIDAATWFRFNCGAPASPHAQRRMVLESAIPLSSDLVAKIARLCEPAGTGTRERGPLVHWFKAMLAFRARLRWVAATSDTFVRRPKDRNDQPM
jgi:hypothetical protein